MPDSIRGGMNYVVRWDAGSDPDGNLSKYRLERSANNGSYVQIYSGPKTEFSDPIPINFKTVRYRVRSVDSYNESSSYTYSNIVNVITNTAPIISGSDYDYGVVNKPIYIDFVVTDADPGDEVTVRANCGTKVLKADAKVSLGVKNTITVDPSDYVLGRHEVKIVARDSKGAESVRTYTFTRINTPPKFNVQNGNLGKKNTKFTFTYRVTDEENDAVNVVEYLNGEVLRARDNVSKNTDLTITISAEKLQEFKIGEEQTIRIVAEDSNGSTATLTQTFSRANFAPVISGTDDDLGNLEKELKYTYSATDVEGDEITGEVYLDNHRIEDAKTIEDGKEYTIHLKGLEFLKIPFGKHVLRIVATDGNGLTSQRMISFTRIANRLVVQLKEPIETDTFARKVFLVPNWRVAEGAKGKIEVCNNAFDESPTWEDATSMVKAGLNFNFQNSTRTSDKWGVNARVTIERGEAKQDSYIYSLGGSVE